MKEPSRNYDGAHVSKSEKKRMLRIKRPAKLVVTDS